MFTMVLASNNIEMSPLILYQGIGSMPAHIMVRSDLALTVFDEEESETGLSDSNIIAGNGKASSVGDEQPPTRENGPSFKLVHS